MREARENAENEYRKECTFRPSINSDYPITRAHLGDQTETFTRLSRSRSEDIRRKQEEAERQRIREETEECSFRPHINPASSSIAAIHKRNEELTLEERLHHEADNRVAERAKRRKQKESQEQQGWFKPEINSLSRQLAMQHEADSRAPLHKRIGSLQRQKTEHLHDLRVKELEKQQVTFKPHINRTSKQIVDIQQQAWQVAATESPDGMTAVPPPPHYSQTQRHQDTITKLQEEAEKQQQHDCSFKPRLSKNSKKICDQNQLFKTANFTERQMMYARRSKSKLDSTPGSQDGGFRPSLTPATQMLAAHARSEETLKDKIDRLAHHDKKRTQQLRHSIEEEYYGQFSYHPQISAVSRMLAKPTENLSKAAPNKVKEEIIQQMEEEFQKECTFKPQTSRIHGNKQADSNLSVCSSSICATSIEYHQEKEERLNKARREKQYEQLKKCTFHPEVARYKPKAPKTVRVAGLDKYLQKCQQAKQMELDKKKREQEVFKTNIGKESKKDGNSTPATSNALKYTIPKPFKLHTDYHSQTRRERFEEKMKQRKEKEYTFEPNTNVKKAHDILCKYILRDTDDEDDGLLDDTQPDDFYGAGDESHNSKVQFTVEQMLASASRVSGGSSMFPNDNEYDPAQDQGLQLVDLEGLPNEDVYKHHNSAP
eukprot:TRINITY_DN48127_c0_g1_i1.p1 TRINITY_DN48127_c0_g1~~TRINITY_DN48127_c0_g1_i1.p1  ORF type:complete len:752 (+),score=95.83 TRINITY_DN48127_c0_g1_i1:286-2256(+)